MRSAEQAKKRRMRGGDGRGGAGGEDEPGDVERDETTRLGAVTSKTTRLTPC